jgi:predicted ester cyclase
LTDYRNIVTLRCTVTQEERAVSEEARTTAIKFLEEQDRLRGGPADELCADGYTAHLASFPAMALRGHKEFSAAFYAGFPDLKHRVDDVIADGDRVAVRFRITGTNTESFMGDPASGRPIELDALALMTVASGKVTELWGQFDQIGVVQQIRPPRTSSGTR